MGFLKRDQAEEYTPIDDDTLEQIARRETDAGNPLTWQEITKFNWGTDDPDVVDEFMRDQLGCYKRGEDKHFVFSSDIDSESPLLIPQAFEHRGLRLRAPHTLRITNLDEPPDQFKACCKISGPTFEFDKSFVRPSVADDLEAVQAELANHPDAKIVIFGHTDKVGSKGYNKTLSERRAKSVHAFITNDVDTWVSLADQEGWGLHEAQLILEDIGGECDPGRTDGVNDAQTQSAVRHFQENIAGFTGGDVDGQYGPQTRRALYEHYMSDKHDIEIEPDQFMDPPTDGHMGCGERNPLERANDQRGPDGREADEADSEERNETNRRVTFFLFNSDRLPRLPCRIGDTAPCEKRITPSARLHNPMFSCSFYDSLAHYCDCEGGGGGVIPPAQHTITITAVDSPHFIPELETVQITYDITGPLDQVASVTLRAMSSADTDTVIVETELTGPFQATGNTFDWNGAVTHDDYDGFLSLAHSPYTIRLDLQPSSGDAVLSNTEEVSVLLDSIEIFIDTPDAANLPDPNETAIDELVSEIESNGDNGRLIYDSSVFKLDSNEMTDASSFTQYRNFIRNRFGNAHGIDVPVMARVLLQAKAGDPQMHARAAHGAKVLWDVILDTDAQYDAAMNARAVHANAQTFMRTVSAHEQTSSEPQGRTAHRFVGGMRDTFSARNDDEKHWHSLRDTWGQDDADRPSAALSECGRVDDFDCASGIFVRPGRMSADTHHIKAYVELADPLTGADDATLSGLDASQQSNEIAITNWRRLDVVAHHIVGAAATPLDVPGLNTEYNKCAVIMRNRPGVAPADIQAQWATEYAAVRTRLGEDSDFVKYATLPDPGDYPVSYRSHQDYLDEMDDDSNFFGRLWNRIRRFFGADGEEEYIQECRNWVTRIIFETAKAFPLTEGGLTFFKWRLQGSYNIEIAQRNGVFLAGIAPSIPSYSGRHKAVFFVFNSGSATQTLIHEVGHLVFLAHAPGHFNHIPGDVNDPAQNPAGYQIDAHDQNDGCTMSYLPQAQIRGLCGLCQFKMNGWDYLKVHKDATVS